MSDSLNSNHNMNYKTALQAQARSGSDHMTPRPVDQTGGSATVEAALVLPFFLCAICTLCVIAQFILAETAIYHAAMQTVRVYAKQESTPGKEKPKGKKEEDQTAIRIRKLGGMLETRVIFSRYLDKKAVSSSFLLGGRTGILLTCDSLEDQVNLKASYGLKVPVPYFKWILLRRSLQVSCRKFTGYTPHEGDGEEEGGDTVYVTEYGRVYHTSLSCSHLTIRLTDPETVQKVLGSARYRKCDKCIRAGQTPSQLYYTKYGDCYHSTLACSGLKRSVRLVKKSEIAGMKECSECGKKH
ncbi:MAG: pilus assembly protein [Eubacterium sp.]|nr:pilus assembly protein [Eubacterium sp.]